MTKTQTAGRIDYHPVFPDKKGWAPRRIETEDDARDAIELLRLNYDRVVGLQPRAASAARLTVPTT